jgi:ABC-type enterochelin transport system permease subunit
VAVGALLCSVANAYEAIHVRPNSLMSIVDWAFALIGFLAFLGLLLSALSNHFSRPEGQ